MDRLQRELEIAKPAFLKHLASSKELPKKVKRFKITVAASMGA